MLLLGHYPGKLFLVQTLAVDTAKHITRALLLFYHEKGCSFDFCGSPFYFVDSDNLCVDSIVTKKC